MKTRNPKFRIPKRRNLVALHARNLKGGRHSDKRKRRTGSRDWRLEELLDETNDAAFGDRDDEGEDR